MGHRNISAEAAARAGATVERELTLIRRAAESALAEPEIAERFAGALSLAVLAPLAEGADQIIAAAAERSGCALGAILPFDQADYEGTFDFPDADASRTRLRHFLDAASGPGGYGVLVLDGDPSPAQRDEAFMVGARHITHWTEILVALLADDRHDSQTGQSVHEAIATGMPVLSIDPQKGTVRLFIDGVPVDDDARESRLAAAVRKFFMPAEAHEEPAEPGHHHIHLADYRAEHIGCHLSRTADFEYAGPFAAHTVAPFWARWCAGLNRAIERSLRRRTRGVPPAEPPPTAADLPFGPGQAAPFVRLFLHFHRADVLAGAYAELYRSAHLVIAGLGVATVALGSLGAVLGMSAVIFSGFELFCFIYALCLVWISNRQGWLARWTNYRLLAEIYRYAKFLVVTGRPSPFGDAAVLHKVWTRDHTEQVLRTYGLAVPGRGRAPAAEAMSIARRYVLGQCVDDQIRFHEKTVPARQRMAKLLSQASYVVSVVTVIVLSVKFAAEMSVATLPGLGGTWLMKPVANWGEVLAIVLPALTAAVLALRAYGEHEVVAKRSLGMIESLGHERRRVAAATNLDALGGATLRVARTLLSEVGGWVDLFVDKHLEA